MANSDIELVERSKGGDNTAFDELVYRHQERVFVIAYHILGNAEDASDVQQETFVRAWTKIRDFRGKSAFPTWLHSIAVNICLSKKRRKWTTRTESIEDADRMPCIESIATDQNRMINAITVRELLDCMPLNHRVLLLLREVEEMSIEEIAQVLGSSVDAVTKQLWRVRKTFRERLQQYMEEVR